MIATSILISCFLEIFCDFCDWVEERKQKRRKRKEGAEDAEKNLYIKHDTFYRLENGEFKEVLFGE